MSRGISSQHSGWRHGLGESASVPHNMVVISTRSYGKKDCALYRPTEVNKSPGTTAALVQAGTRREKNQTETGEALLRLPGDRGCKHSSTAVTKYIETGA